MGFLITIEGGEFVGKTSVAVPGLKAVLTRAGVETLTSREPGGTPEGERIRSEIFAKVAAGADQKELAVLFNKARRIHLDTVIKPFLGERKEQDRIVILDRYLDSTRVYQGLEGSLGLETVYELEQEFVDGYYPDLTFILYIPEDIFPRLLEARRRMAASPDSTSDERNETAWDDASVEQQRIRQQRYLSLKEISARRGEQRAFVHIDASRHPYDIISEISDESARHAAAYRLLGARSDIRGAVSRALRELRTDPFWIFLEKQWKRQERLMSSL
jgi:dTMP kinase